MKNLFKKSALISLAAITFSCSFAMDMAPHFGNFSYDISDLVNYVTPVVQPAVETSPVVEAIVEAAPIAQEVVATTAQAAQTLAPSALTVAEKLKNGWNSVNSYFTTQNALSALNTVKTVVTNHPYLTATAAITAYLYGTYKWHQEEIDKNVQEALEKINGLEHEQEERLEHIVNYAVKRVITQAAQKPAPVCEVKIEEKTAELNCALPVKTTEETTVVRKNNNILNALNTDLKAVNDKNYSARCTFYQLTIPAAHPHAAKLEALQLDLLKAFNSRAIAEHNAENCVKIINQIKALYNC